MKKIIKPLASLNLAVLIIILLAILSGVGTFVEARYDATAAKKLVYNTWWMYSVLILLSINLIAVMVDRLPWKWRHAPFICAHIGIIFMLLGAIQTSEWGLDGSMQFGIGQKNRFVTVPDTELRVWSTITGDDYTAIHNTHVDFFTDRPSADKPFQLSLLEGPLEVIDYKPYALPLKQVLPTEDTKAGSALRFQVQAPQVSQIEWLVQRKPTEKAELNLGPATFVLGPPPETPVQENKLFFTPLDDGKVQYTVFYKDQTKKPKVGIVQEAEEFEPGWMTMKIKVLRFMPKARETFEFQAQDRPTPLTNAAVAIRFNGQTLWVQQNDLVKFFTQDRAYLVSFGNVRIDINFDLKLKEFEVGRYEGTNRAASYQSLVETPEGQEVLISMNEPLKYKGLTFYQASFTENPDGSPNASILSVNYDPGRFLKYLGSLIMSIGIVWMFYNKRKTARARAPATGASL